MRDLVVYAVIRLGLWALLWWGLTLLDVGVLLAAVLAAVIAMLVSILFLDRLRSRAALRWKDADDRRRERRGEVVDEDADAEDALVAEEPTREQRAAQEVAEGPQAPAAGPGAGSSAPADHRHSPSSRSTE